VGSDGCEEIVVAGVELRCESASAVAEMLAEVPWEIVFGEEAVEFVLNRAPASELVWLEQGPV
jgi:hypothetical protein